MTDLDPATKAKNTDDLFAHFEYARLRAAEEPSAVLRACAIKSARDSEWHVLFACLLVEAMRPLYDGARIADRLEALRNDLALSAKEA